MIALEIMTLQQCHELYRHWETDPAICQIPSACVPYVYSSEQIEQYYRAKQAPGRILFAIVADGNVVGELHLKNINTSVKECTLSIHLQNDSVKGKGYGTQAELLAIQYAFDVLDMNAVNADALLGNTRSQHVLQKAGFRYVREDDMFRYFRIERRERHIAPEKKQIFLDSSL